MKSNKLSIQRFENASGTVAFRIFGYLHGERVRRNFATREEAATEQILRLTTSMPPINGSHT